MLLPRPLSALRSSHFAATWPAACRLALLALLAGLLLQPASTHAQATLTGQVRDSLTQAPLPFASVFLANTTLGVNTNEQGQFVLLDVPAGSYDLVASYIGHRLAKQHIVVGNTPLQVLLQPGPAANQLSEVLVRPNPNRASDYQKFVALFLGQTTFSRQCRIQNPDDILVDYDPAEKVLTAAAYKFVRVDNLALGYRIKYYGLRFSSNFKHNHMRFYGQPVFEEMTPRNARQQQRWQANRLAAYRGSLTHFLKSVREGNFTAEGFEARRLRIVPNPRFARADSLHRQKLLQWVGRALTQSENDSLTRWSREPWGHSLLYTAPHPLDSLRRVSADGAHVFLRFTDYLQVRYLREPPDPLYPRPPGQAAAAPPSLQVSELVPLLREVEIQPNGQLANPLAVLTEEYWGFEKMGEFLPVNYQPPTAASLPKPTP